jgi:hypothetical protein
LARDRLSVLDVARDDGWKRGGTLAPEFDVVDELPPGSFDGCYYPAYAQRIKVDDVVALANALEQALPHIPDIDSDSPPTNSTYWIEQNGPIASVVAELAGRNKYGLREFIAHCREGGEIWIC